MTDDEYMKEFCSKCINRKGFEDICEIRKNIKGEPQCMNFDEEKKENNGECEKVLKELDEVRLEKLNDKAKRLFEAIMKIADRKDEAESDLYEANNRINDLLDIVKLKDEIIDDMVEEYEYNARINLKNFCEDEMRKDKCIQDCKTCVRKYFEERCK